MVERRRAHRAAVLLAVATVAVQVAYPLATGEALRRLTVGIVVLFFVATVTAVLARHGARGAAAYTGIAVLVGLVAEAVGVRTGLPFGTYAYAGTLGPEVLDVPVVVPLAWAMMAYPALVVARTLTRRFVPVVGGVALATWDLFLDPRMVAQGHWTWASPEPALPGAPGIPLTNYAGWLLVATLLIALLHRALPPGRDLVPGLLYLWTYASSILAAAVFFDAPGVALLGGIGMGLVAVPYAWALFVGTERSRLGSAR